MHIVRTDHSGAILTLAELKSALHLTTSAYDNQLGDILAAVTDRLDGANGVLNSSVLPSTWELHLDEFPSGKAPIALPYPPINAVTALEYDNETGIATSALAQAYVLRGNRQVCLATHDNWPTDVKERPTTEPVRITFTAGYNAVPPPIKLVAKAMAVGIFDGGGYHSTEQYRRNPNFTSMLREYRF